MSPLRRLIEIALAPFRSSRDDTSAELHAVEADLDDLPLTLRRARAFLAWQTMIRRRGQRVEYGLGFGGKDPHASHPFQADRGVWRCDCSGMVCCAAEVPRQDPVTGVWRNTDRLEFEAREQGIAWDRAELGDVVVYGAGPATGHCGIVSAVGPNGPTRAIHCAKGRAIVETDAGFFRRHGARILRLRER